MVERYDKIEAIRKELKQKEQVEEAYKDGGATDAGPDDDDKIAEDQDAAFGEVKQRVRTAGGGASGSVRNLRIREDTAKYLFNLDLDSAHYDPKTRSMREDPLPNKPDNEKTFKGDNFVRKGGDVAAWNSMQMHAMEAFDKGANVNMLANPSLAEMMYKQFKTKKDSLTKQSAEQVAQKYGNAGEKMPEEVSQLMSTERYVEYDRNGRVVKGTETKVHVCMCVCVRAKLGQAHSGCGSRSVCVIRVCAWACRYLCKLGGTAASRMRPSLSSCA